MTVTAADLNGQLNRQLGGAGQFRVFLWPDDLSHSVLPPPEQLPNEFALVDRLMLSTLRYETFWGGTVAIYAAKMATRGWTISSPRPRLRNDYHGLLHRARAGLRQGWIPFITATAISYLCCRYAIIEIERMGPGAETRAVNLHHLNPLRCRLTDDADIPVIYKDTEGNWHELRSHQVIILTETPLISEADVGLSTGLSAAYKAYPHIYKMAAIETYFRDKVTGRRPLTLDFVSGISDDMLSDLKASYEADAMASKHNVHHFRGSAIAGLLTDKNIVHIRIPLSEIPDGFDRQQETELALLAYANVTGLDPQDLRPLGGQALGVGSQSQVLHAKQKGRSPEVLANEIAQQLNTKVLPADVTFAWYNRDLQDEKTESEVRKSRAETRSLQVATGEITPDEARTLAIRDGDLPTEFIKAPGDVNDELADDLKPILDEQLQTAERTVTDQTGPEDLFRETLDDALLVAEAYR